jgi:tetratricopeptide (TPR) repeat protein
MKKFKYILTALFLLLPFGIYAQRLERKNVRQGNNLYEQKKYTKAEVAYRKALEVNPHSSIGSYNLGNALYKQKKGSTALEQYQLAISHETNPMKKAAIMHNSGNVFMQTKNYDKAVDSYKTSLKFNPNDNETRYNLAMAQALLKKQQKDKKNNKDKQKDQKNQQQQQQNNQEKKQNKQQQQKQQQQEQVTKEKAKQLLDALSQDEKETQDKVKKLQMQRSKEKKTDKDW